MQRFRTIYLTQDITLAIMKNLFLCNYKSPLIEPETNHKFRRPKTVPGFKIRRYASI